MTIEQRRNLAFQKKVSRQVTEQMNDLTSLLTQGLNIHLNIGQQFHVKTPSVFMSTEILSVDALINKVIHFVDNARVRLPKTSNRSVNGTERTSLRVRFFFFFFFFVMMIFFKSTFEPLASFGQSNTNLSTSISLTRLDEDGKELSLNNTVELLIPRDPTSIIPPMFFQNVTSLDLHHQLFFNLHYVDLSDMSDVSVHLEMHPLSNYLSYLLIYRFDRSPVLNTSLQQIDGWTLFCPASEEILLFCLLDLLFLFRSLQYESLYFLHRQSSNLQPSFADLWSS